MADANPSPRRTIADHGVVGDLETAALVSTDATIDFLCWPRLDSPSIFAALLDPDAGGSFEIEPELTDAHTSQLYVPETNVLTTRWRARDGGLKVSDLMPFAGGREKVGRRLIRRVRATRGRVTVTLRCRPRFDYAREVPVCAAAAHGVEFTGRELALRLDGSVPINAREGEADARFVLDRGEEAWFVLGDPGAPPLRADELRGILEETVAAWRAWSDRSTYRGRWRERVTRSALALKLLTSAEHGSIAAAATFGLPEAPGGVRNWDYRATWIRDASFTVYAFLRLGYHEEAEAFRDWVSARISASSEAGPFRIMYAIDGGEVPEEFELPHLTGYDGAQPVRVGNAARDQHQLDVYGELLDTAYLTNKYGNAESRDGWTNLRQIVEHVVRHWREPDAGIWEMRTAPREFLHSRLMCWVALDRALRLAAKRSLSAPVVEWASERDRIAEDIWSNFRHPKNGHFVQERGGTEVDGSLLMMPLMRFVAATDPVWLATLEAIGEQLSDDGLIRRYRTADGLTGDEGAFSTCSFWYVECLARAGRLAEAQIAMDDALGQANHLGLSSEETSNLGEQLGNFPQALTHLAFISAAFFLDRRLDPGKAQTWQP